MMQSFLCFCYRDPASTDRLTLQEVKAVVERMPIRSVNLGTGENGMHPGFEAIVSYLRAQPVKLTITSNGHSIAVLQMTNCGPSMTSNSHSTIPPK